MPFGGVDKAAKKRGWEKPTGCQWTVQIETIGQIRWVQLVALSEPGSILGSDEPQIAFFAPIEAHYFYYFYYFYCHCCWCCRCVHTNHRPFPFRYIVNRMFIGCNVNINQANLLTMPLQCTTHNAGNGGWNSICDSFSIKTRYAFALFLSFSQLFCCCYRTLLEREIGPLWCQLADSY